mmetsp:Transcript_4771/g.4428  ORF Transcript_4771/g.4428 Transcript_4771/m.4428 type:complete len:98 (+) Transcript_4771:1586-1879(+)|eukprot:CAMPEP_0170567360 /NCGR_PEP_ID=MMETSP0211-20121228/80426_1 /TAXON_ID=311385 /ORGANISM="Pseudokeronopsis sp., Strain OXSARD2" /LENGTH=97 /DNA_ID=CAMNT_0010888789 /DNA_START=1629 /DNA_END=1922 /DNA_ORIENTATION=-
MIDEVHIKDKSFVTDDEFTAHFDSIFEGMVTHLKKKTVENFDLRQQLFNDSEKVKQTELRIIDLETKIFDFKNNINQKGTKLMADMESTKKAGNFQD